MLRNLRDEWDMSFADGGESALRLMEQQPFDVVVSDMRMPGMNGAQLLTEVMRRWPRTVRIVLSGQSDREMILRSVGPTHQYLAKPCDAEVLKGVVYRACELRDLLSDENLKTLVTRVASLPSLPDLYLQIVEEVQSPDASIQKIGDIIARDVGMTAKLLQLVNSAFFGLRRHVPHPAMAASLLGLDTVKALVLTAQVFSSFESGRIRAFALDGLWRHSVAVGAIARKIAAAQNAEPQVVDFALLGGLLHDVGRLILAANLPAEYAQVCSASDGRGALLWQVEREKLGTTHGEVGAYLLGLWGLPDPIVEAVAYHHMPTRCLARGFTPLTAVHVADALELESHGGEGLPAAEDTAGYLAREGLSERLESWRRLAAEVLAGGGVT